MPCLSALDACFEHSDPAAVLHLGHKGNVFRPDAAVASPYLGTVALPPARGKLAAAKSFLQIDSVPLKSCVHHQASSHSFLITDCAMTRPKHKHPSSFIFGSSAPAPAAAAPQQAPPMQQAPPQQYPQQAPAQQYPPQQQYPPGQQPPPGQAPPAAAAPGAAPAAPAGETEAQKEAEEEKELEEVEAKKEGGTGGMMMAFVLTPFGLIITGGVLYMLCKKPPPQTDLGGDSASEVESGSDSGSGS